MAYKTSSVLCLALVLAFSSATHGLDITKMLSKYPEFSKFSQYLTETKLAEQINSRKTITILALDNNALSSLNGKSPETIKAIISTHVLLDYFDEQRLMIAEGSHSQITTLFQASGLAKKDQGFIYVALINEGEVAFASAVQGAQYNTKLVRTVITEPFNIAILEVTEPIVAPGIEASSSTPTQDAPAPAKVPVAATPAAKVPVAATPAPAKVPVAATPAPTNVPVAATPAPAMVPVAATPASHEDVDAAAPAPTSAAFRTQMGLVGAVVALASLFFSM